MTSDIFSQQHFSRIKNKMLDIQNDKSHLHRQAYNLPERNLSVLW